MATKIKFNNIFADEIDDILNKAPLDDSFDSPTQSPIWTTISVCNFQFINDVKYNSFCDLLS